MRAGQTGRCSPGRAWPARTARLVRQRGRPRWRRGRSALPCRPAARTSSAMARQAAAREATARWSGAGSRWPTGRWRSGPCRRSAARATGRRRNRPAPPACSGPGRSPRRCRSGRPAARRRAWRCAGVPGPSWLVQSTASSASRASTSAPNRSRLSRASSPRDSAASCRSRAASHRVEQRLVPGDRGRCCRGRARPGPAGRRRRSPGRRESSASTTTSLGPAMQSMATWPKTCRLARVDEQVARPDDHVHGGQSLDAVGQGGDRLGAADAVDLGDAQLVADGQQVGVVRAVRRRRHDDGDLLDAGRLGRADGHQQRRGIGRRPAGDADADAAHRPIAQPQLVPAGARSSTASACSRPSWNDSTFCRTRRTVSQEGAGRRRRGPRPARAALTRSVSGVSRTLSNCSV